MTTPYEPCLARAAALMADPTRSRMLSYLLSGEFASAGELATAASVTPSTASGHLSKLLDSGLLACEVRGRHRYYRLADAEVAHALEALAMVAERGSHAQAWSTPTKQRLRYARCCYGHIAGRIGVSVMQSLLDRQWLTPDDDGFKVTEVGASGLSELGMDGAAWLRRSAKGGRGVAYGCMDWSERRDHLAGKLAAEFLRHFVDKGWLRKTAGDRALELTPPGHVALRAWLPAATQSLPVGETSIKTGA